MKLKGDNSLDVASEETLTETVEMQYCNPSIRVVRENIFWKS